MKKVNLLSRAEMKKVMGGVVGSCTYTQTCAAGSVSCTSTNNVCNWVYGDAGKTYTKGVQCDQDPENLCPAVGGPPE